MGQPAVPFSPPNIYEPKETVSLDSFKNIARFDVLKNIQLTFQHIFIPIIAALILFGQVILPRIPFSIGGGEPREIELKIKHDLPVDHESRLFLIGESSQFIFVVAHNKSDQRAFQINKSEVEYIQTRKNLIAE